MIFNGVVGTARQHLRHLCPLVAVSGVGEKQDPFLMGHPLNLEDRRVEMVVPPLSTLFSKSAFYKFSDKAPSLWSVFLNESTHQVVFLFSPWLLSEKARSVDVGLPLGEFFDDLLFWDLFFLIFFAHNLKITAIIKSYIYTAQTHLYFYNPNIMSSLQDKIAYLQQLSQQSDTSYEEQRPVIIANEIHERPPSNPNLSKKSNLGLYTLPVSALESESVLKEEGISESDHGLRMENMRLRQDNLKLFAECVRLRKLCREYQTALNSGTGGSKRGGWQT